MRCGVIGAGAWGTALANVLASNGHDVQLWAYEPDVVASVNDEHVNHRFLAEKPLHPALRASGELGEVTAGAEMILFVAPSHVLRRVARGAVGTIGTHVPLVVATKGIERETLQIMTEVIDGELPGHPVAALSGPSFAAEVADGQPTAVVAASTVRETATLVQHAFSSDLFRVYTHDDVIGVELGGALKNVMAVATGITEGLGLGFNSRAALITRGLAEMTRLGTALGASPATFAGLAGIGDLVLTCTGALSRNRAVGVQIGQGRSLDEVMSGRETVAEGVTTTQSAFALAAREGVEMPIVTAVHRVLFEGYSPRRGIAELMGRGLRSEQD